MPEARPSLLEFPCTFPIKVMGLADSALADAVLAAVTRHDPGFNGATMEMRASSGGRYISLTCTFLATSQAQVDALYRELTGHPLVKVVL